MAERRGHRPRKRFGQNFLHDPGVIRRIVDHIAATPDDHLLEIGPGQGALTRPLLESGCRLDVVELDRDLIPGLEDLARSYPRLTVHQADALRLDLRSLFGEQPLRVVGNLPYNISTPLLFHLFESEAAIRDYHFMLQKEVVGRMAATPGSRQYGRLSVMTQLYCRVDPLFTVPPGAFNPPPRVTSTVVRLEPHPVPPARVDSHQNFQLVVRSAFSQRRKTLGNALKGLLDAASIRAAGVDPGLRAERLTLAEFAALANRL